MSNDIAISESQNFLTLIQRLATDPNVEPAKISAILDIQERMIAKRAEAEFNEAFLRLREKLPIIKKGDIVAYENKKTGKMEEAFKFAKWEKVQAIIDDIIASEGFDLTFDSTVHPNGTAVVAILHHKGGHTRRTSTPPIPIDSGGGKNNVQGVGSSMSYGQRYATKFALNLRFEDDDDGVKAGLVFISPAQISQVNELIAATKTDTDRFLRTMNVVAVENLTTELLPVALNMLQAKKATKA
jgi:hypothetical protein